MEMKEIKLNNDKNALIREAQIGDANAIITYLNKLGGETDFLTFGENEFYKTVEEEEEILKKFQEIETWYYLVIEVNNTIVGHLDFEGNTKRRMKHSGEFGIGLLKEYWGQGLASILMNEMIMFAKATGVLRKINLMVSVKNEKAISLYKKFGFEIEGTIKEDIFVNGQYNDGYCMGLFLH
jgi:RimJ/RimL family protein N-acetyltransferase